MTENYINHIALVLDASYSMHPLVKDVVKVADEQTAYLAKATTENDQETRITVYTFNDSVKCAIYDKDVLRLPSVKDHYRSSGNTALIDATFQAIHDLEKTAQLYGDHAFLVYVLTDGQENASVRGTPLALKQKLESLPENWTVAALVPNQYGVSWAERVGFPRDNIVIWETTGEGVHRDVGANIRTATDNYMTARASGVRGTKKLFSMGTDVLNRETVKEANLKPLAKDRYALLDVKADATIPDFVEGQGLPFVKGKCFYELTKSETIQEYKEVALRNRKSGRFYVGPQTRDLLGLPDMSVRVKPDRNPEYQVFVQSTSMNRRVKAGTKLLVLS